MKNNTTKCRPVQSNPSQSNQNQVNLSRSNANLGSKNCLLCGRGLTNDDRHCFATNAKGTQTTRNLTFSEPYDTMVTIPAKNKDHTISQELKEGTPQVAQSQWF